MPLKPERPEPFYEISNEIGALKTLIRVLADFKTPVRVAMIRYLAAREGYLLEVNPNA